MEMEDIKMIVEGLLPYTERHYQRMARLQQVREGGRERRWIADIAITFVCTCTHVRGEMSLAPIISTYRWIWGCEDYRM